MLKIKKILGILLALCFLVSVTAATAAAGSTEVTSKEEYKKEVINESYKKEVTIKDKNQEERKHGEEKRFGDRHERKQGWGERENHRFNDHHKKRHHHPAHWEHKRVGHREFRNNQWTIVYVVKKVYVAEYYDYHEY